MKGSGGESKAQAALSKLARQNMAETFNELAAIDLATCYMTSGRDGGATRYEFHIAAYELEPSAVALDGEAFPITLARQGGYASKAQAHSAGLQWCAANLPIQESAP